MTTRPFSFERIDHVGIATVSLTESLGLYRDVLGMRVVLHEHVTSQATEVILLHGGDTAIELLAPSDPTSAVGRFLAERGPGMHHLAYKVTGIVAALAQCAEAGLLLVDEQPRIGAGGHLVAFLHPRSTGRVLIELVQKAE